MIPQIRVDTYGIIFEIVMLANSFILSEKCLLSVDNQVSESTLRFINTVIDSNIPFVILQYDHTKTKEELIKYYSSKGLKRFKPENFFYVVEAAIHRLKSLYPTKNKVAYIGGKGLEEIILKSGFLIAWDKPDYIFVGQDTNATYDDYSYIFNLVKHGTKLIAIEDDTYTLNNDKYTLGIGNFIDMIENVSKEVIVRITMPQPMILGEALSYINQAKENAIFVAADIRKEIECANRAKMNSVYVGDTFMNEDVHDLKEISPTYLVENLEGLLR